MTTDWFRVDCDIPDSPKVGRLADVLRMDVPKALGHFVAVLAKVRQHRAHGGALGDVPDTTIEQWALWTGRRGRFAAAFREVFCDADGTLSGWAERQEPLIRRLEHDRERARETRERRKGTPTPPGPSGGPSTDSPRTVPVQQVQRQEQRTTQPPSTRALALVEVATGTAGAADSAVRPRLPAEYRPDLDALLDTLPADQRPSWLRSIGAKLDGMHGPPVAPAQLGEALRAFGANGADRKLSLFDGYVRRAALPPRAPPVALATGTHGPDRRSAGAVSEANALRGIAMLLGEEPPHSDREPR